MIAQTCPELGTMERGIDNAIYGGAQGCYIHGGFMSFLFANNRLDEVPLSIEKIKKAGFPAGIAAHNPKRNLICYRRMYLFYKTIWRLNT